MDSKSLAYVRTYVLLSLSIYIRILYTHKTCIDVTYWIIEEGEGGRGGEEEKKLGSRPWLAEKDIGAVSPSPRCRRTWRNTTGAGARKG